MSSTTCFLVTLFLAIAGALPGTASAGRIPGFTEVLVPVWYRSQPGAGGSLWSTELNLFNFSDQDLSLQNDVFPVMTDCPPVPSQAVIHAHTEMGLCLGSENGWPPAWIVNVRSDRLITSVFSLRVHEDPIGINEATTVPVVPEERLFDRPFYLARVPSSGSRVRTMIRIYDLSGTDGEVRVQIWNGRSTPLAEKTIALQGSMATHPGYAQFYFDGSTFSELAPFPEANLLVRVVPTREDQRLWAMASVTDNATQSVQIILPQ